MDGLHRGLWTLLALALLGAAVAGLLAGTGLLGPEWQTATVPALVGAEIQSPSRPSLLGLGVGGLLLFLLGILLVRATVPIRLTRTQANLRLARHGSASREAGNITIVRAAALRRGLERDLRRIAGVEHTSVVLEGSTDRLVLEVSLDVDGYADLSCVRAEGERALQRLETTAGNAAAAVDVIMRVQQARRRLPRAG